MEWIDADAYLEIFNGGEQLTKVSLKFPRPLSAEEQAHLDLKLTIDGQEQPFTQTWSEDTGKTVCLNLSKSTLLSTLHFDTEKFINTWQIPDLHMTSDHPKWSDAFFHIHFVQEAFLKSFTHAVFENKENALHYSLYPGKPSCTRKPLVIFLHGSGERGAGNDLPLLASDIVKTVFNYAQEQEDAVILVPQASWSAELNGWFRKTVRDSLFALIKSVIDHYAVDEKRVYLIGVSNGGAATWHMLQQHPQFFSAAIPVCGYIYNDQKEFKTIEKARYMEATEEEGQRLKDIPIWAFHATDDPIVSVEGSRSAVQTLKKCGNTQVKLTEFEEGTVRPNAHASWELAFDFPDLLPWLFQQKKKDSSCERNSERGGGLL